MTDSIDNQTNQLTPALEQNTFHSLPNPRNKRSKNKVVAALALILLLVVGAVSSFILLNQKQDTRNQASVENGLINVKLQKAADCVAGQSCYVDVLVNTGSSNVDALQAKIIFSGDSVAAVSNVSFKDMLPTSTTQVSDTGVASPSSERKSSTCVAKPGMTSTDKRLRYCINDAECPTDQYCDIAPLDFNLENVKTISKPTLMLNKNEVSENKEITLVWTLSDNNNPLNTGGSDYLLGRIEFKANAENVAVNQVQLNLDKTVSKATLYKTGQDSLNTPAPLSIALTAATASLTEGNRCKTDANCASNQYCYYEPTPSGVQNKMANAYCKNRETTGETNFCRTDADCKPDQYCYQTPQPSCPAGRACPMIAVSSVCKEKVIISSTPSPTATVTPARVRCKADSGCPTGQFCYYEPTPSGVQNFMANAYCKEISKTCETNNDCPANNTCYQPPMPACPAGKACPQVMPAKYCKEANIAVSKTPTPTPTTIIVTAAPPVSLTASPSIPATCSVPDCKGGVLKTVATISSEFIAQRCPTYVCVEVSTCQYDYSAWSSCNYGVQTRTLLSKKGCETSAPILKQACSKQCSSDSQCLKGETCVISGKDPMMGRNVTTDSKQTILPTGYCSMTSTATADLNRDGVVNVLDLSIVIKNLFSTNMEADVNKDKVVDISDYSLVLKEIMSKARTAY